MVKVLSPNSQSKFLLWYYEFLLINHLRYVLHKYGNSTAHGHFRIFFLQSLYNHVTLEFWDPKQGPSMKHWLLSPIWCTMLHIQGTISTLISPFTNPCTWLPIVLLPVWAAQPYSREGVVMWATSCSVAVRTQSCTLANVISCRP